MAGPLGYPCHPFGIVWRALSGIRTILSEGVWRALSGVRAILAEGVWRALSGVRAILAEGIWWILEPSSATPLVSPLTCIPPGSRPGEAPQLRAAGCVRVLPACKPTVDHVYASPPSSMWMSGSGRLAC